MSKTLSRDEILHIAKLANISLSDDEIERYAVQLSEILKYVDKLGEVDTDNIPAMTHTIDSKNVMFEDGTENERNLQIGFPIESGMTIDKKTLHSLQKDGKNYFKVDRIM